MATKFMVFTCLFTATIANAVFAGGSITDSASIRKVEDIIIYSDTTYFATFPSVIKKPNGNVLVAFRRAPDRKFFAHGESNHIDPNSYLVTVESSDGGRSWSKPALMFAHPYGGTQEPNLFQMSDGTLICTSYLWVYIKPSLLKNLTRPYQGKENPYLERENFLFSGGYILRSFDDGETWGEPLYPPTVPTEKRRNAFGEVISVYNRGQLSEGRDGRLYWAVAAADAMKSAFDERHKTSVHLMTSDDKGVTWDYASEVATDDSIVFNETSLYETPKGDLVAFMRTRGFRDTACIARSTDGGKTFGQWESMGFRGHPLQALKLPDDRVLLVYGYRHRPFGVRARILNAECTDFDSAEEFVVRDDGGGVDVGYPWAVMLDEKQVLVTYYLNHDNNNGNRFIGGSILEIE